MPFVMGNYIQSVEVKGTVYVGGGHVGTGSDNDYIVMTYDISTGKWASLPPYRTRTFAMTSINNQLVLVGGCEHGGGSSNLVGVWRPDIKQWTHPYPEMHIARTSCSAVVYNEWLVVAGGVPTTHEFILSSVEVMNIERKQWYAGPRTCIPWYLMKTAIVGDECFFMSGFTGKKLFSAIPSTNVYSVSLPYLISKLESNETYGQVWKEISGLRTTYSTPLSIRGSLLAVGGKDNDRKAVTAIHLYQPVTGEWVKVGDLPTPRYYCTCTLLNPMREIFVIGGLTTKYCMNTMDRGLFK